jgi:transposase-like protein
MDNAFKWRHYEGEIILQSVRWYLRYALSYRDLEEMLAERGLSVDHTTIFRWVQAYAPEIDQRSRPHLKPTNDSWRVDETYVKVKGVLPARCKIIRMGDSNLTNARGAVNCGRFLRSTE